MKVFYSYNLNIICSSVSIHLNNYTNLFLSPSHLIYLAILSKKFGAKMPVISKIYDQGLRDKSLR